MKLKKAKIINQDKRGKIIQIFNKNKYKESNFVISKIGTVRGGHYHKKLYETFFVIEGIIEVTIIKKQRLKKFQIRPYDLLIIEPYELHTFKMLKNSTWINLLTKNLNSDIWK